jgi:hypothetical protein
MGRITDITIPQNRPDTAPEGLNKNTETPCQQASQLLTPKALKLNEHIEHKITSLYFCSLFYDAFSVPRLHSVDDMATS